MLKRYNQILHEEYPVRYRLTKHIAADFDSGMDTSELLAIHTRLMDEYRSLLASATHMIEPMLKKETESPFSAFTTSYSPQLSPTLSLLDLKCELAHRMLSSCNFCERRCGVDRTAGETGFCKITDISRYASEFLHMGEEEELIPSHTIFFTGCVFGCVYCQNWDIATSPMDGSIVDAGKMKGKIRVMHANGALNVNFVTPTPHLHTVLDVVNAMDVNTPVIWNSNMYHSSEAAVLLEGVVDVYLADFRYGNDECALRYSKVSDYMDVVTRNFETAYRDSEILLRQLVIPGHVDCCTGPIIEWVGAHMPDVRFNLMFQYRPTYQASQYPGIDRYLSSDEVELAGKLLEESGIWNTKSEGL